MKVNKKNLTPSEKEEKIKTLGKEWAIVLYLMTVRNNKELDSNLFSLKDDKINNLIDSMSLKYEVSSEYFSEILFAAASEEWAKLISSHLISKIKMDSHLN